MPPAVRIRLALLAEPIIAKQAKDRMEEGKNQYTSLEDKCPQGSSNKPTPKEKNATDRKNKTNYQLAQMADVSDKTVQRYKKIIDDALAEIVAQVDSPI